MSDEIPQQQPPSNPYQAAAWLRARHAWLDQLLTRAVGPAAQAERFAGWLDELVDGFNDLADRDQAWTAYEARHREPTDEDAWQRWRDAGPRLRTPTARALAPMSGGELRMLRLITTLSSNDRARQGWQISDIEFDARGAAVVEDWIAVLRAQHPDLSRPRPDVQARAHHGARPPTAMASPPSPHVSRDLA
jgi:hypothetical protein